MHDAVVVGSGPNGLVAAVTLARAGWSVRVLEAAPTPGGGTRSAELIRPGVVHDVCSAVHPLGVGSPAMRALALDQHGLAWVHPDVPLAHVLDGGRVALLHRSVDETVDGLGADGSAYRRRIGPIVDAGLDLVDGLLSPLDIPPRHPMAMARFGLTGLQPAMRVGRHFHTDQAAGLFAGLAAHSVLPLDAPITAAYGLLLGGLAHMVGWPLARGGSQSIADALVARLEAHGGVVECDHRVHDLRELADTPTVLLDVTPAQMIQLAGPRLPPRYRRTLERFRYGPGACKVDWVLDEPIPWANPDVARAATVHVGGSLDEVGASEQAVARGSHPERPFVLVVQPSLFDPTRAPAGIHTAWAYCHLPNGSTYDMTERIERQIERFAPGFRDTIVGRHTMLPADLQRHNSNYIGGDIGGGSADLRQFVARPRVGLHPWVTPLPGVYLCSSSTPPGGGVHGMCGWHAAREVLRRTP